MTELEKMLPELNPAQQRWLQGYIAEQRIEELERFRAYAVSDDEPSEYKRGFQDALWQVGDVKTDRIAQLKKESRG